MDEYSLTACLCSLSLSYSGYTIPLDKRLAADGRGLQSTHINENFAKLSEALYIADRKAREAVEMRSQVEKKIANKEKVFLKYHFLSFYFWELLRDLFCVKRSLLFDSQRILRQSKVDYLNQKEVHFEEA